MNGDLAIGMLVPFVGTILGSGMVFLTNRPLGERVSHSLEGFAAGVMVAASVWSLLVPAMEQSAGMGRMAWVPATVGFLLGMAFLLALDNVIPHLHRDADAPEGLHVSLKRTTMLALAVTLHNIPEGMAVGVVYAGWVTGGSGITLAAAFSLALGIAIQNFPEGAIISLPLRAQGEPRAKAFAIGVLSAVVEPIGSIATILAASHVVPILPYMLGFAAGAMIYVVVEELVPEMSAGEHSNVATIAFALGFALMMVLDIALG